MKINQHLHHLQEKRVRGDWTWSSELERWVLLPCIPPRRDYNGAKRRLELIELKNSKGLTKGQRQELDYLNECLRRD